MDWDKITINLTQRVIHAQIASLWWSNQRWFPDKNIQDLVGDIWVLIFGRNQGLDGYDAQKGSLAAYVGTIARNGFLDELRRRKARGGELGIGIVAIDPVTEPVVELCDAFVTRDPGPEDAVARNQAYQQRAAKIAACLTLSEKRLLQYILDGYDYEQIAVIMGLKIPTLHNMKSKILAKIRDADPNDD